jgi:hypothetical protein
MPFPQPIIIATLTQPRIHPLHFHAGSEYLTSLIDRIYGNAYQEVKLYSPGYHPL